MYAVRGSTAATRGCIAQRSHSVPAMLTSRWRGGKMSQDHSNSTSTGPSTLPVVAIGASAGGLEQIRVLLADMPADTGAAFVVLQHLDPSRSSQLAELLERSTEVPVVEIEDGMTLDADRVHVIPPGHDVTIEDGHLRLTRSKGRETAPRVIDAFFRELASVWQHNAVGIILSGTGSDGTLGLKAIRAAGGLIPGQHPDTAG